MEKIYYYTDFNTFKLILENGTLRFKESTSSNDKLDSVKLFETLAEIASKKLDLKELNTEQEFFCKLVKYNGANSRKLYLVACFTDNKDSRLLWDAYTMHRKDRTSERYNGVCIEFNKNELEKIIQRCDFGFDFRCIKRVNYGFDDLEKQLEDEFVEFSKEVEELSHDDDQSQNFIEEIRVFRFAINLKKCIVVPTLNLMNKVECKAPFIKADFWKEEKETRALLSTYKNGEVADKLEQYDDGSRYYDLEITEDCISKIILGPEFSDEDEKELLEIDAKIPFDQLNVEDSSGKGIITNK